MSERLYGHRPIQRIAWWLRCLADRIDPDYAPRGMSYSFTFERGEGIRIRDDGRGARLYYLSQVDYARAHSEADCNRTGGVIWSSAPEWTSAPWWTSSDVEVSDE